jgi:hypothetical protein
MAGPMFHHQATGNTIPLSEIIKYDRHSITPLIQWLLRGHDVRHRAHLELLGIDVDFDMDVAGKGGAKGDGDSDTESATDENRNTSKTSARPRQ